MTEQIRLRIDSQLAEEAHEVCREIGITPTAAVSMFFAQMVKLRGLPFRPSDFPALEDRKSTRLNSSHFPYTTLFGCMGSAAKSALRRQRRFPCFLRKWLNCAACRFAPVIFRRWKIGRAHV